jgi:hypothetical protein
MSSQSVKIETSSILSCFQQLEYSKARILTSDILLRIGLFALIPNTWTPTRDHPWYSRLRLYFTNPIYEWHTRHTTYMLYRKEMVITVAQRDHLPERGVPYVTKLLSLSSLEVTHRGQ